MRTFLVALLLNLIVHAQPAITASDAWIAESGADGTAAAYLSISNPTMYDIYVVKATSEAAGKIELRDGDKSAKDITVPSYGSLELTAAGPHLMLMDVKQALKAGENVTLTLMTDGGVTIVTTAVVKAR
ncbi:MAG: copper chaperone PCu(A)C [Acidobacteriota bacterium]|nr:copper chaperone PCu(A)C [Acidobacteriota bacterium]